MAVGFWPIAAIHRRYNFCLGREKLPFSGCLDSVRRGARSASSILRWKYATAIRSGACQRWPTARRVSSSASWRGAGL